MLYIVLNVFFAYFYTSITFNPIEVADNMKKQGGFIPGIRPGKPTAGISGQRYLNYLVFIGAAGLIIVVLIPIFFNGVFGAQVSFGGTSIIIIVGVILETLKQIESQMLVRNYKGFLSTTKKCTPLPGGIREQKPATQSGVCSVIPEAGLLCSLTEAAFGT